ncbi:MAG: acetyl-CoA carboxylase carboxyltransferase subunit alpha [Candidatus Binatus sp.]|uniref:acetyl-CoA carboxylase carboxyltransferase subunit alpha n=1 Tax=Candidatus Binatus sp. TaxID=2811406 RepID=UPI002719E589|nr:acetyl-CoA carboxylase carboxyltransferase subunit alpha [Candidatus Binatus sp.]MDO8433094.1 acetyl-CoA carboxylase carboxyltransferase subunit alpha [Candidatus Binatus sp.]
MKGNLNGHKNRRGAKRRAKIEAKDDGAAEVSLSAIERVRLARNPMRPQTLDYVDLLIRDFFEIHGDRRFADDRAIVAGLGYFGRRAVAIVGQQRGRTTTERLKRNFGKPHPEGYRKAARVYELADRFSIPLITFIDTQGGEAGVGAEERGQIEAIAHNLELMARLTVPVIACVIGEGGSGGALALGVANIVLMQENACYSVITPEGCAAILWRAGGEENVAAAASALKISAPDLLEFGIIDEVVSEPQGGAHTAPAEAAHLLGAAITRHLEALIKLKPGELRRDRDRKFAAMGAAYLTRPGIENDRPIG